MIALASSLLALVVTAAQPSPAPPPAAPAAVVDRAAPVALPPALEQEARAIERMVIAPCCWMQPVSDHQSQASDEVKQQIRAWLAAGKTRQQVLDGFVEQYGVRVLAEPPNEGFSRFLYLTPIAAFGLSAIGLFVFVRRWTGRKAGGPREADAGPADSAASEGARGSALAAGTADYEATLDDELRELD
jgi:cytochrome c-type biogenesis protein CcmH